MEKNCNNCLFQKERPEAYLPNYNKRLTCCTAMVRMSDGSNVVYGHTEKGNGMCEVFEQRGVK